MLLEKFRKYMDKKGLRHGMQEDKYPDKEWLVAMIATLNPDDEIFGKGYVPPPRKNVIEEQKTIRVPEGFFEGLPDSKSKVKRRALHIIGEGKAQQKMKYLKAMQAELNAQVAVEQMKAGKARSWLEDPRTKRGAAKSKSPAKNGSSSGSNSKRTEMLLAGSGSGGGKQGSTGSKQLNESFGQQQPQGPQLMMMQGVDKP